MKNQAYMGTSCFVVCLNLKLNIYNKGYWKLDGVFILYLEMGQLADLYFYLHNIHQLHAAAC